jgi:hypothetical protein
LSENHTAVHGAASGLVKTAFVALSLDNLLPLHVRVDERWGDVPVIVSPAGRYRAWGYPGVE